MAIGAGLLIADLMDRFVAPAERASVLRTIGLVSAGVVTIAPVLTLFTMTWSWPFPLIAATYVGLYIAFVAGTVAFRGRWGMTIQRLAYGGFLVIAALPSWMLLLLTPAVALAGVALVRQRQPQQ